MLLILAIFVNAIIICLIIVPMNLNIFQIILLSLLFSMLCVKQHQPISCGDQSLTVDQNRSFMYNIGEYHNITISQPMVSPSIPDRGLTSDLQYTVKNLVPEALYTFHIIARNVYGDSFTKSVNCTTDQSRYIIVDLCLLTCSVLSISFYFELIS